MDHWCELGALCHDALAGKYGRATQHPTRACAWLFDGRGSMRTGQSRPALLTVLNPRSEFALTPVAPIWLRGLRAPGGHP